MHLRFPYGKRHKYPHMKPQDILIWERFIEKFPEAYEQVSYDFAVGSGPDFSTIVDEERGSDDRELYLYKIDVVGFNKTIVDLIEIKPRAGLSAIGQAAAAKLLWKRDHDPEGDDRAVIITDVLRPDMKWLCEQMGIRCIVV